jgi:Ca2+-binding EF-hand superfamily protein
LFDKSQRGQVATSELGNLVRALNINPTETEIQEMVAKVDPKQSGSFNCQDIEKVVRERGKDKETLQDLVDALKVFDADHDGKITVSDFKHAMMTMGERMGEREIDEIVGDTELVNNDAIIIEEFAKMIMSRI